MDTQEKNKDFYSIDIAHIFKSLWRRAWLICLCGLLTAAIGFSLSAFVISPKYSSSVKLYVNNGGISSGDTDFTINSSELSAAQSLVRTYGEILNSRGTLERVINEACVDYTWKELSEIIEYAPSSNTEIMRVTVTTTDPYESSKIANTIADVLPERIAKIIKGASMEVVDEAVPEFEKVSPSIPIFTIFGFVIGVFISVVVLIVKAVMDDTIHESDYILKTYNYPILGKIPNLVHSGNKSYAYYSRRADDTDNVKKDGE